MPLPFRIIPTTTVIRQLPTGAPQVASRTGITQVRTRVTAADCADPKRLAKAINDVSQYVEESTQSIRTDPAAHSIYFIGLSWTSGTPRLIVHNLGRPYQGYLITRSYGGATAAITLYETALPGGLDPTVAIMLVPSATGTGDLRIW